MLYLNTLSVLLNSDIAINKQNNNPTLVKEKKWFKKKGFLLSIFRVKNEMTLPPRLGLPPLRK